MAKLSELLTGDPKTWRKVVRPTLPYKWIQYLGVTPTGIYLGYSNQGHEHSTPMESFNDWEYYEEPKSNGYVCAPYADQHLYINANGTCQCGHQKRLLPTVMLTNTEESRSKVKRWLWGFKENNVWRLGLVFLSDDESLTAHRAPSITDLHKLPWTETLFDS